MFENTFLDFATVSAVVAAFVSVVGNAFNIEVKFRSLLAILLGVILVVLPVWMMEKVITALLIGLTASGVYTQVKKRDYQVPDNDSSNLSEPKVPRPPKINGPDDV
ncbi:hypothetical protein [Ammoniphilus sp. 3BR4]|uniref:hypothetical protein n=1 Tax=Ammoniphilus sp. 3BR4 TaxID=3158265 RepID=UPI003467E94A